MRYIPVGGDEQLEWFAIPIKFVTAESDAVPNAARNIPPPLVAIEEKPAFYSIFSRENK
jgi:hypothetical protein